MNMKRNRRVITSISFPADEEYLIDEIQRLAQLERKTWCEIVRRALKEYLEKHGEGNPQTALTTGRRVVAFVNPPANLRRDRLDSIVEQIALDPGVEMSRFVSQLAARYGLKPKTIRDYIETLGRAGRISVRGTRLYVPREG